MLAMIEALTADERFHTKDLGGHALTSEVSAQAVKLIHAA
jgi:hypothetical protein